MMLIRVANKYNLQAGEIPLLAKKIVKDAHIMPHQTKEINTEAEKMEETANIVKIQVKQLKNKRKEYFKKKLSGNYLESHQK